MIRIQYLGIYHFEIDPHHLGNDNLYFDVFHLRSAIRKVLVCSLRVCILKNF